MNEDYMRYGNIDKLTLGLNDEHEETSSEKQSPHVADCSNLEANYINKTSQSALSMEAIKSQRDAARLKINLMKEPSVDEELPPESHDGSSIMSATDEDLKDQQSTPKRPSTPLSIQRGHFTLSSVSIT